MLSRRTILSLACGAALTPALPGMAGGPVDAAPRSDGGATTREISLRAAERPTRILGPGGPVVPLWTYADTPLPVIRARQGDRIRASFDNGLAEHTSIHWHGIRLPSAMDGVPYLSQDPVLPGGRFTYDFTVDDAGSYFFHPHCDESGQVGRGLAGLLIVEGDERTKPDAEVVLVDKDWRLSPEGTFLPFSTDSGASRAGTFGTVRAVNARLAETVEVPAGGLVRVRLYNLDSTRLLDVGIEGGRRRADAALIAVDGHRLDPRPFGRRGFDTWKMGPAMRADLAVAAPAPGEVLRIVDYQSAEPWTIATLIGVDAGHRRRRFDPDILARGSHPLPRLADAERFALPLAAAGSAADYVAGFAPGDPLAAVLMDALCVRDNTFWSIDGKSWPSGDHRNLPPPLRELVAGRSYIVEIENRTPHPHPLHLHGHVFRVLSSARAGLPVHDADTVIVQPRDRIEIAFVATPGLWMIHCHVLDHLETGMMGYLKVV